MKLPFASPPAEPPPMSDQDLQDWGAAVDAKSNVGGPRGETPDSVINAGQAAVDILNARRGRK